MKKKGHKFECGCIAGHYWCAKHDIYTKQDPKDPPPHKFADYPEDFDKKYAWDIYSVDISKVYSV